MFCQVNNVLVESSVFNDVMLRQATVQLQDIKKQKSLIETKNKSEFDRYLVRRKHKRKPRVNKRSKKIKTTPAKTVSLCSTHVIKPIANDTNDVASDDDWFINSDGESIAESLAESLYSTMSNRKNRGRPCRSVTRTGILSKKSDAYLSDTDVEALAEPVSRVKRPNRKAKRNKPVIDPKLQQNAAVTVDHLNLPDESSAYEWFDANDWTESDLIPVQQSTANLRKPVRSKTKSMATAGDPPDTHAVVPIAADAPEPTVQVSVVEDNDLNRSITMSSLVDVDIIQHSTEISATTVNTTDPPVAILRDFSCDLTAKPIDVNSSKTVPTAKPPAKQAEKPRIIAPVINDDIAAEARVAPLKRKRIPAIKFNADTAPPQKKRNPTIPVTQRLRVRDIETLMAGYESPPKPQTKHGSGSPGTRSYSIHKSQHVPDVLHTPLPTSEKRLNITKKLNEGVTDIVSIEQPSEIPRICSVVLEKLSQSQCSARSHLVFEKNVDKTVAATINGTQIQESSLTIESVTNVTTATAKRNDVPSAAYMKLYEALPTNDDDDAENDAEIELINRNHDSDSDHFPEHQYSSDSFSSRMATYPTSPQQSPALSPFAFDNTEPDVVVPLTIRTQNVTAVGAATTQEQSLSVSTATNALPSTSLCMNSNTITSTFTDTSSPINGYVNGQILSSNTCVQQQSPLPVHQSPTPQEVTAEETIEPAAMLHPATGEDSMEIDDIMSPEYEKHVYGASPVSPAIKAKQSPPRARRRRNQSAKPQRIPRKSAPPTTSMTVMVPLRPKAIAVVSEQRVTSSQEDLIAVINNKPRNRFEPNDGMISSTIHTSGDTPPQSSIHGNQCSAGDKRTLGISKRRYTTIDKIYPMQQRAPKRRETVSYLALSQSNSSNSSDDGNGSAATKRVDMAESPALLNAAVRQAADRTYSKDGSVQNVFVPPEVELIIEDEQHNPNVVSK